MVAHGAGFLAALALAAGGAAWRYLSDFPFADYRTGTGERRSISLPDGSRIDLAAQSRVSVAFDATQRKVVLHEGEAFFKVAAQLAPFTVHAGNGTVTALGTEFAVEYRDQGARVMVTNHAVRVRLSGQSAELSAGNQVRYEDGRLGGVETAKPELDLLWREGKLAFASAPLGEVVQVLNRWRRGKLVVVGGALAARRITLIVDLERSEAIPLQLERILPLRAIQITSLLIFIVPS